MSHGTEQFEQAVLLTFCVQQYIKTVFVINHVSKVKKEMYIEA